MVDICDNRIDDEGPRAIALKLEETGTTNLVLVVFERLAHFFGRWIFKQSTSVEPRGCSPLIENPKGIAWLIQKEDIPTLEEVVDAFHSGPFSTLHVVFPNTTTNPFNSTNVQALREEHHLKVRREMDSDEFEWQHIVIDEMHIDSKVPPFASQTGGAHSVLTDHLDRLIVVFSHNECPEFIKVANGPGGAMERGHSMLTTLMKECSEEAGIILSPDQIKDLKLIKVKNSGGNPKTYFNELSHVKRVAGNDTHCIFYVPLSEVQTDNLFKRVQEDNLPEKDIIAVAILDLKHESHNEKLNFASGIRATRFCFLGQKEMHEVSINIKENKWVFQHATEVIPRSDMWDLPAKNFAKMYDFSKGATYEQDSIVLGSGV